MEEFPSSALVAVSPAEVGKVRALCGLDEQRVRTSVDQLCDWMDKQPHLQEARQHMSRMVIERIFLLARGSVEAGKRRIERLLTLRACMPDLVLHRTLSEVERLWNVVRYISLPRLHPEDQSRVMVTQILTDKLDEFNVLHFFRYCFLQGEYRLHYDYCVSERFIYDLSNVSLGLLTKLNPIIVKKSELLCTEGFGTKIKGIHFLHAPGFVDRIVSLVKTAVRAKVAARIHVHPSLEDLHKHVPREILPSDYGGDAPSCAKLAEQWQEELKTEKAQKIIAEFDKMVSDETKRSAEKFNEEYLGMPGSFRKLTVD